MTNLVAKYSSSSELSNPTVVNTNCCISPENHPPKFLGSRANCCICCSCFHSVYFDTLGSTSPVVEHLAQVKNLRHIQQAASRLLLLYFALQKDDMRLHRQDLFENSASESIASAHDKLDGPLPPKIENSASESIASAHDKLDGPLPPKIGVVGINCCIYKICCVSPKVVYTKLLYLARKYTDLLYLARSHPPSELCENIFELWEIVGAVQSTRRAGQQRHHAELWRWIVMA